MIYRPRNSCLKHSSLLVSALILLFSPAIAVPRAQTSLRGSDGTQIRINLSLNKRKFKLGEPIELRFEITNLGKRPILVGNSTNLNVNLGPRLDLELKDAKGHSSPGMHMIADSFGIAPERPSLRGLLGQWLLLWPDCSYVTRFRLDREYFESLGKPGIYHLSGAYISPSFSDGPTYRQLGLTEDDMKSIPFPSWSGTFNVETLSFQITAD